MILSKISEYGNSGFVDMSSNSLRMTEVSGLQLRHSATGEVDPSVVVSWCDYP